MTWYDTNYQFKKQITIDHTKVTGGSDLSSFPVLISRTDADLKTVANGGSVQNANGYDIIFVNSAETTLLDFEIEHYVASTGEIEMWVRIPTLSHTADTVIYLYYDNSTITTSQENITGVWDSNFAAVYHMQQTAGTSGSIKDSTSNANNGTPYTNYGSSTVGNIATSSGQIDGAQSFDGANHSIEVASGSTSLNIGTYLTISAWVQRSTSTTIGSIILHGHGGIGGYVLEVGVNPATTNQVKVTKFGIADITIGTFPADTSWHHVVESGDSSGTYVYIDGSLSGTSGDTSAWNANDAALEIGGALATADNVANTWNGAIDEVRISKTTRPSGWIGTEYNNQSSPSTFYSTGSAIAQVTTTTYSFTEALTVSRILLVTLIDLPLDANTGSDIPGGSLISWTIDALTASDNGTMQSWNVDALTTDDSATLFTSIVHTTDALTVSDLSLVAPLTLYAVNLAATTITTANKLISTGGGSSGSSVTTKVGTATGWGEIYAQGSSASWPSGSVQGAPTGNGWLFESSILEGQEVVAGDWKSAITLQTTNTGVITATLVVRYYVRRLDGTYELLGSSTLSSQSILFTGSTTFALPVVNISGVIFLPGDKIYTDLWLNITSGAAFAATTCGFFYSASTSAGWTGAQLITPGYEAYQQPYSWYPEDLTIVDSLLATGNDIPVESLPVSDVPGIQSWNIEALTADDSATLFIDDTGTIGFTEYYSANDDPSLTVYNTTTASTTLATSGQLIGTGSGTASSTGIGSTLAANATAWGEITALGTTSAWAGSGSQGAPTGKGWILDSTALEGQQIVTGSWNCSLAIRPTVSITATVTVRFYKRSSGNSYTFIGSGTSSSQNLVLSSTAVIIILVNSVAAMNFATGDKLYMDWWLDITSSAPLAGKIQWYPPTNQTAGYTNTSTLTPGYVSTSSGSQGIFTDSLTITDVLLKTDSAIPLDALSVSDVGGNLQSWNVDSLSSSDSAIFVQSNTPVESLVVSDLFLQTDISLPLDTNTISDLGNAGDSYLPTDANSVSDLGNLQSWNVDGLSSTTIFLDLDTYLPVDGLSITDLLSGNVTNNSMTFEDDLAVTDSSLVIATNILVDGLSGSDSLLATDGSTATEANVVTDLSLDIVLAVPIDTLTSSDSLLEQGTYLPIDVNITADLSLESDSYLPIDALSTSDTGTLQSWGIDSLIVSDVFLSSDTAQSTDIPPVTENLLSSEIYLPVDTGSIADTTLAIDTTIPGEALSTNDLSGMQSWNVDGLSSVDSLLETESYVPVEALVAIGSLLNTPPSLLLDSLSVLDGMTATGTLLPSEILTASDSGTLQSWSIDALIVADALLSQENALFLELATTIDGVLTTGIYLSIESLSITDTLATGSINNNVMASEDDLTIIENTLFASGIFLVDGLSTIDGQVFIAIYLPTDGLTVLESGNILRWPIDVLSVVDSQIATDTTQQSDMLVSTDLFLSSSNALSIDTLSSLDTFIAQAVTALLENGTITDALLSLDAYSIQENLSASDLLGGGILNNLLSATESLFAVDTLLVFSLYLPSDLLSVVDSFSSALLIALATVVITATYRNGHLTGQHRDGFVVGVDL